MLPKILLSLKSMVGVDLSCKIKETKSTIKKIHEKNFRLTEKKKFHEKSMNNEQVIPLLKVTSYVIDI